MVSFIPAGAASFVSVMGVLRLGHVNWTPGQPCTSAPMICYRYRYSAATGRALGMWTNSFLGKERLVGTERCFGWPEKNVLNVVDSSSLKKNN